MDFVEICKVYVGKMIIKAAKRIFNSDKICRSYSDLNFGVTFLEHSVCLLVYKARNSIATNYSWDLCVPVPTRAAVCSAAPGDLVVPPTRLRLENRAFCVAGPTAWNSLTSDIRTANTFKKSFKTHLFLQSNFVARLL